MMEQQTQTATDDYWNKEEFIATLPLPPQDVDRDVSFLWHQSREKYGRGHKDLGLILKEPGERDYIHVKACFYSPRIVLTVALTPPAPGEFGEEIGEVMGSRNEGQNRHEFASLQAWYYPTEKTLMLWEVDLFGSYGGEEDQTKDFLLSSLWVMFERRLLDQFPDCERVLTPHHEPDYDRELFQAFLRERGYAPGAESNGIFEKFIR